MGDASWISKSKECIPGAWHQTVGSQLSRIEEHTLVAAVWCIQDVASMVSTLGYPPRATVRNEIGQNHPWTADDVGPHKVHPRTFSARTRRAPTVRMPHPQDFPWFLQ